MLVLTRRFGESVIIEVGNIKIDVRIVAFNRGSVRLGIAAPPEVKVNREEIWERKNLEN